MTLKHRSRASWLKPTWLFTLAIAIFLSYSPTAAQSTVVSGPVRVPGGFTTIELFGESDYVGVPVSAAREWVVRERSVELNRDALIDAELRPGDRIGFRLFPDAVHEGVVERIDNRGPGRFSIYGRFSSEPMHDFQLVVENGVIVGNILVSATERYELRVTPNGTPVVREVVKIPRPWCGFDPRTRSSYRDGSEGAGRARKAQGSSVVDLLILWTPTARIVAGGTAAIKAIALLAVDAANLAYQNSNVAHTLRVAGWREISDLEGCSNHHECLDRLIDPKDGLWDEVHPLRDALGADLVSLFLDGVDASGVGGNAYLGGGDTISTGGFSTVAQDYAAAAGAWVLAHETGHNMGSGHDISEPEAPEGLEPYSRGHRFTGNSGVLWGTIMAYNVDETIQHFSNPNIEFDGQPTGVPVGQPGEAYNRRNFSETDGNVSGYRDALPTIVWVNLDDGVSGDGTYVDPFNSLWRGVTGVHWGGAVRIFGSSTAETPTIDKAMTIEGAPSTGTVIIGQE